PAPHPPLPVVVSASALLSPAQPSSTSQQLQVIHTHGQWTGLGGRRGPRTAKRREASMSRIPVSEHGMKASSWSIKCSKRYVEQHSCDHLVTGASTMRSTPQVRARQRVATTARSVRSSQIVAMHPAATLDATQPLILSFETIVRDYRSRLSFET